MPITTTHPQRISFPAQFSKLKQSMRHTMWWGPVWRGLFVDPTGKHYRAMGRALWLYGYLIVHADRRSGTLFRAVSTISSDMQISGRTVQVWLSKLRRHGYITTRSTGRALRITIEKWKPVKKMRQDSVSVGVPFRPAMPAAYPASQQPFQ